jgi:hypothetical protein
MQINIKPKSLDELQPVVVEILKKTQAPAKSQVVAVFDISGSMDGWGNTFYSSGLMHALATRVLALGLQLDDDGQIPVYTLGSGSRKLPNLTKANMATYIKEHVEPLVGEGTQYAPFIEKILKDANEGDPMLVLVFTDGDNSDHAATRRAIKEASKLPIFFQWYGIYQSKSAPDFPFLEKMDDMGDRVVDNCGFSPLGLTLSTELSNGDEVLYEDMLKEYKDFPAKAAQAGSKWENKRRRLFGLF